MRLNIEISTFSRITVMSIFPDLAERRLPFYKNRTSVSVLYVVVVVVYNVEYDLRQPVGCLYVERMTSVWDDENVVVVAVL